MKLEATSTVLDLDFEIPQPGISIAQVLDGIEKRTNEKSGKTTLKIPLIVHAVVEGPASNQELNFSHFVPIETPFGEKQLASILTMTGLVDSFAKKFGSMVDITDDAFVNALKLKLPGKFIQVTHDVRVDNGGKNRVSITRLEGVPTTKGKPAKSSGKPTPAATATEETNEDW